MARQSTNPALTRIPALSGRGSTGDRSYPPPTTPPAGSGPQPYGSTSIDYTKRGGPDVGFDRSGGTPTDVDRAMTLDDVIMRTGIMIGTVFAFAAIAWVALPLGFAFPAAIVGLVIALVVIFKQITNPAPILAYAAVEGVFLGTFSKLIAGYVGGSDIVVQALVGTAGVAALMLFLYKSGRIRVTPQFQKMVVAATGGFFVLIMANLVFSLFTGGAGLRGGFLGIIVGVVAIGLASMNLVLDFDLIEKSVRQGVPERYGWLAAFGLVVTLVWLYVEILRLLALLTGRD